MVRKDSGKTGLTDIVAILTEIPHFDDGLSKMLFWSVSTSAAKNCRMTSFTCHSVSFMSNAAGFSCHQFWDKLLSLSAKIEEIFI